MNAEPTEALLEPEPGLELPAGMIAYRKLIADAYFESESTLDVRFLWRRERVSFFRVNWRGCDDRVTRSRFVAIDETFESAVVRDLTGRHAA